MIKVTLNIVFLFFMLFSVPGYTYVIQCEITKARDGQKISPIPFTINSSSSKITLYGKVTVRINGGSPLKFSTREVNSGTILFTDSDANLYLTPKGNNKFDVDSWSYSGGGLFLDAFPHMSVAGLCSTKKKITIVNEPKTTNSTVQATSLPKCPSDTDAQWHNCFGTYTYRGNIYVGEWKNGSYGGQGTFTYDPNGEFAGMQYIGEWKYGKWNGQGALTHTDGSVEEGIWKDDEFQNARTPTTTTVGTCLTKASLCSNTFLCQLAAPDVTNGKKAWFSSSSEYYQYVVEAKKRRLSCGVGVAAASNLTDCPSDTDAQWHNCFGTFIGEGGEKYVGEWKDNEQHGQGTYTWPDGDKYVGEFKDDNFNGQGTFTWSNGDKYVGEFKDGNFNGQGTYTHADGKVGEGTWKDDKLNGQATVTDADGTVKKGIWKDDEFQNAKTPTTSTSSVCSTTNLNACSNAILCSRGSGLVNGVRIWDQTSQWSKYSVEAKKRGLSCGVKTSSSTTTLETTTPKIVPVAPKEKPETITESASSLINPLQIKKYGKTFHTPLLPNTILFIGEIEDGDTRGFRAALRAHEVDRVVLLSGGGLINEGLRIANIINDKSLATYVPVGTTCASACSFMFFAGNPKVAHGRLGVHQFYVEDDKEKVAIGEVQKSTQYTVADIIQNLNEFGTPASVFPKMLSTSKMYYFTETEKSAFSDINKIIPETLNRINEVLSYFIKDIDNELDDTVLNGMPQKTKSTLIQLELIRIGCMQGPADGIGGEETKSAIELLSSKMKTNLSFNKFSDLFKSLNNTKEGRCY